MMDHDTVRYLMKPTDFVLMKHSWLVKVGFNSYVQKARENSSLSWLLSGCDSLGTFVEAQYI